MKSSFDGVEGALAGLSQFSEIIKKSNIENYGRLTEGLSKAIAPSITVSEIVGRQTQLLSSLNLPDYTKGIAVPALESQWKSLAIIANACKTPEIMSLQTSLIKNEVSAVNAFAESLKTMTHIEAPNIALLKIAPILRGVSLPKGVLSTVKGLHVETANRLMNSDDISFDVSDKKFYVEASPSDRASVSETNIICSSSSVLPDISESELIAFLNVLWKTPTFASANETGMKIHHIVASWDKLIDFDYDCYYHARALEDGKCPYTEFELGRAPEGYTGHGRYNYVGRSHYYFSDKEKGAIIEVEKHRKEKRIQVATLRPNKSIKMIDLSIEIASKNKFLEYCRFSPNLEDYSKIRKEYLIPCYVADCCKKCDFDGIKYYGSKEYKNYVTWKEDCFDIVSTYVQNRD